MSFQAMSWAVKQECKTPTSKLILILIANYADENNSAFPSKDHLSKLANCDERTIRRSLRALVDAGYVTVQDRHDASGRQTSNRYILNLDNLSNTTTSQNRPHREGDIFAGEGVTKMPPNTNRNIPKEYTSDFEDWWSSYPRKDGSKKKAFESYISACKEISPRDLLAKTIMFAESRKGEDIKFTPHATTWLNQKRYETVTETRQRSSNLNALAG